MTETTCIECDAIGAEKCSTHCSDEGSEEPLLLHFPTEDQLDRAAKLLCEFRGTQPTPAMLEHFKEKSRNMVMLILNLHAWR